MYEGSWNVYEVPVPRRWMFRTRRRSVVLPLLTMLAAALVAFEAVSRL